MSFHEINSNFSVSDILKKHIQRQPLTRAEQDVLDQWLAESDRNQKIFASLNDEDSLVTAMKKMHQSDTEAQWEIVSKRLSKIKRKEKLSLWPPIAAAMLLFFGIGIYWFAGENKTETHLTSKYGDDVLPGTNRATITLSNGESIVLGDDREGIATDGDAILYNDGTEVVGLADVQYATLTTPVGGQYQVRLPDGTRAWLNAASSITYPTQFRDGGRSITVTGEVFLEVATDAKRPFVVTADEQHIEVLGTSFNINAYGDQGRFITTLTEGRLKVTNTRTDATALLHAGQQAIVSDRTGIALKDVDTEEYTSWKDGVYFINDQPLTAFGVQIERWYDVTIDMGGHGERRLSAMLRRDARLSEILEAIEIKTGIKFKIEGRRITAIK